MTLIRLFFAISLLFAGFHPFLAKADFEFTENCRLAYSEATSLRFQLAETHLMDEIKGNPTNDFPYLLQNYIDFLVLTIGEDQKEFEARKINKDKRLNRFEKGSSSSPYFLYAQAETHLLWAMIRLKFGEYLTAANETNKAYHLLTENAKRFPDFLPNKNALGQMHCIIGAIPSNFKWAIKLIGMDGTLMQGISELKQVLQKSKVNSEFAYLWTETAFFMTFVELNLHKDETVINDLYSAIKQRNDPSPLITFCLASIAMKTGRSSEAIEFLIKRPTGSDYFPFYYLDFLLGIAYLNHLDSDCNASFIRFISNFKGKNYIKSAYQKLAWSEIIKGNVIGYRTYMQKVKENGFAESDEDKQAQKEAESELLPNVKLLKARLLCDGGYYKEALAALVENYDSDDFVTKRDQLEFPYRLGRIYHLWKKTEQAIPYYKLTIENGKKSNYYFAANAALQLGLIYESRGDKEKAKLAFEDCLKLPKEEYANSLDAKARSGIQRVR